MFTKLLKPVDNLFGRHAFYACKQGTTRAHGTIDSESLRGLGPYGEQSEFTSNIHTTYRDFKSIHAIYCSPYPRKRERKFDRKRASSSNVILYQPGKWQYL